MRTWTETHREGTDMGPLTAKDWKHPFVEKALTGFCNSDGKWTLELLKEAAEHPERFMVSDYGGWPRIWKPLLGIRLYDGSPYWEPRPAVQVPSALRGGNAQWFWLEDLSGLRRTNSEGYRDSQFAKTPPAA